MTTETAPQEAVRVEPVVSAYEAAGKLLARRYLCCFCGDMRQAAITKLNDGPEQVIQAFADYSGMLCGAAEWATGYAREWLRANAQVNRPQKAAQGDDDDH